MANGTPNNTLAAILSAYVDGETFRVALINDTISYTYDPDTDEYVGDVLDGTTAEEFGNSGGTGYSRQDLTNVTVTSDDTNDRAVLDADDVTFPSLDGETIQGAIFYRQVGADDTTPGDDEILEVYDDDQADIDDFPIPTNGSDIAIQIAADGINALAAV